LDEHVTSERNRHRVYAAPTPIAAPLKADVRGTEENGAPRALVKPAGRTLDEIEDLEEDGGYPSQVGDRQMTPGPRENAKMMSTENKSWAKVERIPPASWDGQASKGNVVEAWKISKLREQVKDTMSLRDTPPHMNPDDSPAKSPIKTSSLGSLIAWQPVQYEIQTSGAMSFSADSWQVLGPEPQ
jgi:hypothetical protein